MDNNPLWYKDAVFYEVYTRAFRDANGDGHGDLRGLAEKLDYIQELGVDCIWLMPINASPLLDDGYDIADYYHLHPDYGVLDDFKDLLEEAHQRGLRVIFDLVLNHTSDQHAWFQQARRGPDSPYHNYYVWSDDDQKYSQARIIFVDSQKSNWTWDEQAGRYFWHRFYPTQPDLNYDNPAVQEEMLKAACFWLDLGVDGFRADAVPYLFEREGTNCENLPETHAYLKRLRAKMEADYPGRILLCEANQWPRDVRPYFGEGDEFHMGFHFPLMPRIYMALRKGGAEPVTWVLEQTPPIPDTCQWCTFLRNHDELTLEMVTEEERQWMWAQYAPEPRMRLNLGIRRRLAPLLNNDRRQIELANALLFSLPGSPVIYYGDEIGMGDDIWLFDRNGVRTPMQWEDTPGAGFSEIPADRWYADVIRQGGYALEQVNVRAQRADPASLLHCMRRLLATRKQHPAFSRGDFTLLPMDAPPLLAYLRRGAGEMILVVNNLSSQAQVCRLPLAALPGNALRDLFSGADETLPTTGELALNLPPYGYRWLQVR
jgi:maltose alpha-D-glucosyltransferase/alpha-amylase